MYRVPSTKSSTLSFFRTNFVACRSIIFSRFFLLLISLSYFRPFPVLTVAKMHPYPSCFARFFFVLFSLSHNHYQSRTAYSSLDFFLYIHFLSLTLSLSLFLVHTLSLSSEYNSYVITGGRHPMSISPGMRDERFSPYHLDDLN